MVSDMMAFFLRNRSWSVCFLFGLLYATSPGWWIRHGDAAEAEAQLYRWVDENGAVHYADRIPPADIEQGHTKLNREGVRIETIAPAPSDEEIKQAQERERLKAEEARHSEQNRLADQKLLKDFRTLEDLILAREGKIAAVEALNQSTRDGIRFERRRLRELHKKSAELAPKHKPAIQKLQDEIAKAEQFIRNGFSTIIEQEFRKQAIRKDFEQTIARYRKLKNLPESAAATQSPAPEASLGNLVSCQDNLQCLHDWERALAYVRAQADIYDEIVGTGLLFVFQQDDREERLLTLVWIQKTPENPVYLYLDLECKNRLTANLTCTNQSAIAVRDSFRFAIARRTDKTDRDDDD